jgi:hypothetical protein
VSIRATRLTGLSAVIAAGAVALLAAGAPAAAESPQRFTIYSATVVDKEAPMLVEATGPISGVGLVQVGTPRGMTIPVTLAFPKGKVLLSARGNFGWKPDFATCTATRDVRGTYAITGGTGAYRGAAGQGTLSEQGAGMGVRSPSGKCLQKFKVNYVVVRLTGRTSVGSS